MKVNGYVNKLEAANFLGVKLRTIDCWMKSGLIPYYKFGHSVLFKKDELLNAVSSSRVQHDSTPRAPATVQALTPAQLWDDICDHLQVLMQSADTKQSRLASAVLDFVSKFEV